MCGIGGMFSLGDYITTAQVDNAFKRIQSRGRDACGAAALVGENWQILKAQGMYTRPENREFMLDHLETLKSNGVLIHTRASTHGTPSNHDNNHPILGENYLMIHNGVVSTPKKLPAVGETDTEQMLRHIEDSNTIKEGLNDISGWLAIAIAAIDNPKSLFLYTNGMAPLYVWRSDDYGSLEFSSCQFAAAQAGPKNLLLRVNLNSLKYSSVPAFTKPYVTTYYSPALVKKSLGSSDMAIIRANSDDGTHAAEVDALLADNEDDGVCGLDGKPRDLLCEWPKCTAWCRTVCQNTGEDTQNKIMYG